VITYEESYVRLAIGTVFKRNIVFHANSNGPRDQRAQPTAVRNALR
jgi:hypothetical protein